MHPLLQMGANITLTNLREVSNEPVCDINVKYSKLKAINVSSDIVPRMVDEIPVFVLVATQAEGIKVSYDSRLTIRSAVGEGSRAGKLSAYGGESGAGIGGGEITIM